MSLLPKINSTILRIIDHPTTQRIKVYVMVCVILAIFAYSIATLHIRTKKVEEKDIIQEKTTVAVPLNEFQEMKRKANQGKR